jgi:hypothetical protein
MIGREQVQGQARPVTTDSSVGSGPLPVALRSRRDRAELAERDQA